MKDKGYIPITSEAKEAAEKAFIERLEHFTLKTSLIAGNTKNVLSAIKTIRGIENFINGFFEQEKPQPMAISMVEYQEVREALHAYMSAACEKMNVKNPLVTSLHWVFSLHISKL